MRDVVNADSWIDLTDEIPRAGDRYLNLKASFPNWQVATQAIGNHKASEWNEMLWQRKVESPAPLVPASIQLWSVDEHGGLVMPAHPTAYIGLPR